MIWFAFPGTREKHKVLLSNLASFRAPWEGSGEVAIFDIVLFFRILENWVVAQQ